MTTQDDERAAREWLKHLQSPGATSATWANNAATIIRLLDRPVLPRSEDVPDDVLSKMMQGFWDSPGGYQGGLRAALDMLREHLTAPPPVKLNPAVACLDALEEAEAEIALGVTGHDPDKFIKALAARGYKLIEAADDQ